MKYPAFIRTSIQNKLFSSFLIILLLLVAVITASFLIISSLGKASGKILTMNYHSVNSSIQMMDELDTINREYFLSVIGSGGNDSKKIIEAQNSFSIWLGRAEDNITEPGEKSIISTIDKLYAQYLVSIQQAVVNRDYSLESRSSIEKLRTEIRGNCFKLMFVNQQAMFRKSGEAQRIANNGRVILILMTVIILMLGVVLSWRLSRRIVKPILTLKEATQRLASGDYSIRLSRDSEDELGILMEEFDAMAEKLRGFNQLNIRMILAEQQKSGAILANIQEGILFIGADNAILDANKAALDAIKKERTDVVGHHFLEVIPHDRLFADLKACLQTQKSISYEDHDNIMTVRINDRIIYYEYFFSPVMSDQKKLLGALCLLRDITNLKELDRLKSEFVMIVSHELKTPLTSINMSIDLLKESLSRKLTAEDTELITIAKDEINRLRTLISDLLDLSKIEAGKLEMRFSSVSPRALIESVSQYLKSQIADKGATLTVNYQDNLERIWCDDEKLLLVFSNLIANALKAVSENGRIDISAEISGKFVLFCVRDNGIGIPLSYQNKIFDRFTQVEDQKAARGTGLGLTISREIVRAHGGSIWVESSLGEGSAFYFTIPTEPQTLM